MGETIVIADDEPDLRAIYSEILRFDGHDVREAADGIEALALVASSRPALLLLDVWMPGLSGFEVLDRLRVDPSASSLKVVMHSNLDDADALLEGYSHGVVDYLVKGLSIEEFRERIRQAIAAVSVASGDWDG